MGMQRQNNKSTRLSKTRLLQGLRCPKAAHLATHHPQLASPISASDQFRFDQGHAVGAAARERFPDGVLIDGDTWDIDGAVAKTEAAIVAGATTLFEGAFVHDGVLVRVDVLTRADISAPWRLLEVKSTTSVKDEHVDDLAMQLLVLRGAGIAVESYGLMHLNSACTAPALESLFTTVDVETQVEERLPTLPEQIAGLKAALAASEPPAHDIGPHCTKPYACAFRSHCWVNVPSPSIFEVPNFKSKVWELYRAGVVRLDDERLPQFKGARANQVAAALTGERWVNAEVIAASLSSWQWPLSFLDFETVGLALPHFDGTRPYQQVPFQFSIHVVKKLGDEAQHYEYLHDGVSDPRPELAKALLAVIGTVGSVVAYNATFEAQRLRELAEFFPEFRNELEAVVARLVDPLPVVREGVYDRLFRGTFSLKFVAPALLGEAASYRGLEIGDGGNAQAAYVRLLNAETPNVERSAIRRALLEYCKQDTAVLVLLVEWLFQQFAEAATVLKREGTWHE